MPSALFTYSKTYRPYFNCFKELTHEHLVKVYLFNYYPSVNFIISGKTMLDDILHKHFSK